MNSCLATDSYANSIWTSDLVFNRNSFQLKFNSIFEELFQLHRNTGNQPNIKYYS